MHVGGHGRHWMGGTIYGTPYSNTLENTHTPEILGNCKTKTVAFQKTIANYCFFCLQQSFYLNKKQLLKIYFILCTFFRDQNIIVKNCCLSLQNSSIVYFYMIQLLIIQYSPRSYNIYLRYNTLHSLVIIYLNTSKRCCCRLNNNINNNMSTKFTSQKLCKL